MLSMLKRIGREYALRFRKWPLSLPLITSLMEVFHFDEAGLPVEPARLADALCIPRQTMTSFLDALEQRGLLSRTPHPTDRRRKRIVLSPRGRKLALAIRDDALRFENAALAIFPTEELPAIREKVSRYIDALAAQNALDARKGTP